jgi:ABC-type sugar transport system ATPase subunit
MLARLLVPSSGKLTIGGDDMAELPEAVTGRRIAYVGPAVPLMSASLRDNLLYGLKYRPLREPDDDRAPARARERQEAVRAGNLDADIEADWVDYEAAGAGDASALTEWVMHALELVDMAEDVYLLGLRGSIDPTERPDVAEKILAARERLRERLADPEIAPLVELFDGSQYNMNATVAENLLFGTPVGDPFDIERLAENAYVRQVLERVG